MQFGIWGRTGGGGVCVSLPTGHEGRLLFLFLLQLAFLLQVVLGFLLLFLVAFIFASTFAGHVTISFRV